MTSTIIPDARLAVPYGDADDVLDRASATTTVTRSEAIAALAALAQLGYRVIPAGLVPDMERVRQTLSYLEAGGMDEGADGDPGQKLREQVNGAFAALNLDGDLAWSFVMDANGEVRS